MSPTDIILRIRSSLESLRPAERKVAEVVLTDVDAAMRASITQLAQQAEVSEPTITRFCRSVGCEGLRDFKMLLAQSLATGLSYTSINVSVKDDSHTMIDKICDATIASLEHLRSQIDASALEKTTEAMHKAHTAHGKVLFLAVGSGSGTVAHDASLRFLRLGLSANCLSDGHLQRLYSDLLGPNDIAFGISNSGRAQEVYDSLKIAKEAGALTIAITNRNTPIARLVDIPIVLGLPHIVDAHTPGVSRFVHMCIIDALTLNLAVRLGPASLQKVRHAKAKLGQAVGTALLMPNS